jgi:hypothetical protein
MLSKRELLSVAAVTRSVPTRTETDSAWDRCLSQASANRLKSFRFQYLRNEESNERSEAVRVNEIC